jgi:hypothetical protein
MEFFPVTIGDFGRNLVISLWPGEKQQPMEWRHSDLSHLAQKHLECKNPLENFWLPFCGMKKACFSLVTFQRTKLSTRSITHLCGCNWRSFWRKNIVWNSPSRTWYCTTTPRLTGHLQLRWNWATWVYNYLITHPIFQIWPRRTTTCSLDWKNNWKFDIFRPTWRSLLPRLTGLDGQVSEFFELLAKLRATAKKCFNCVGGVLNR